jgi:ribosomal protein S12 methylthiotransferase accessory factor YcaO
MKLSTAMKVTSDGSHRVALPQQTCERARYLLERIGITDIHDITDYDVLAIPVWSVQQPFDWSNRVAAYGKGVSSIQSEAGAMMEAIEHYSAQQLPQMVRTGTCHEIRQHGPILDLQSIVRDTDTSSLEGMVLDWLPGMDLVTGEAIWVPAACVLLRPALDGAHVLPKSTSNGLAAGNSVEEAVCHALCELIERDAWTLAWLRTMMIPYIREVARKLVQEPQTELERSNMLDDLYPEIDVASVPGDVRRLIARFESADVALLIRDITSDVGIPAFLAVSQTSGAVGMSGMHYGSGSHPNAHVAILRAITECAQGRVVAARDPDSNRARPVSSSEAECDQRNIFFSRPGSKKRDFSSINTHDYQDILDDINCMIRNLSSVGLRQIIAIDLTVLGIDMPVIKILIPGIEDWSVFNFSNQHCILGYRGRQFLES